jgi:hypothetical protein
VLASISRLNALLGRVCKFVIGLKSFARLAADNLKPRFGAKDPMVRTIKQHSSRKCPKCDPTIGRITVFAVVKYGKISAQLGKK